jgi:hypothetical protein
MNEQQPDMTKVVLPDGELNVHDAIVELIPTLRDVKADTGGNVIDIAHGTKRGLAFLIHFLQNDLVEWGVQEAWEAAFLSHYLAAGQEVAILCAWGRQCRKNEVPLVECLGLEDLVQYFTDEQFHCLCNWDLLVRSGTLDVSCFLGQQTAVPVPGSPMNVTHIPMPILMQCVLSFPKAVRPLHLVHPYWALVAFLNYVGEACELYPGCEYLKSPSVALMVRGFPEYNFFSRKDIWRHFGLRDRQIAGLSPMSESTSYYQYARNDVIPFVVNNYEGDLEAMYKAAEVARSKLDWAEQANTKKRQAAAQEREEEKKRRKDCMQGHKDRLEARALAFGLRNVWDTRLLSTNLSKLCKNKQEVCSDQEYDAMLGVIESEVIQLCFAKKDMGAFWELTTLDRFKGCISLLK